MSTKALEKHLEPLKPFLAKKGITEICINQPKVIFVEKNGVFTRHEVEALEFSFLEALANLIAEFNHKPFPCPLLSGYLPTGERIQCIMSPACEKDKIIYSIRCHSRRDMRLQDYQKAGVFDDYAAIKENIYHKTIADLKTLHEQKDIFGFLKLAIQSKKNLIISGGTGTGKTTFLNACLKLIPHTERLITLEDTREVNIKQPNTVNLLFNEEDEQITASKLFKACLRLRPDRLFLSELRGSEAWSFLRAANSGHPGSMSTVHADTPQGCFKQLVFMMQQAGSTSSEENLHTYIKSIIPIVIQLKRSTNPTQFVEVAEIYFNSL
ncbi:type IV secretion system protein VirB11 [Candidatus Rickettsiella viridis]|uniref:Type IV secretion system protein n=1 Tax=Candidatus Rickettsiella viridis TaxID=676208 RepID=A0A2Z5UWS9_9COXI|nr:P-type DNA transfer ATPase VirB11 [Candidatus Rickettsiella viridis]BBB14781.1 type IV secretion system protein VirB11 [Candidatus Rickettsiella viridis]BBB15511.1 type IV secretion system protein VirB11 [Candidatus Rickettsiella viridis]